MFSKGLGLLVVAAGTLSLTSGYKDCIQPKPTVVDKAWFMKAGEEGLTTLVEHSECDNCENEEAWSWIRNRGRSIPTLMCWDMVAEVKGEGEMSLALKCKYRTLEAQECDIDFEKTSLKGKMAYGGNILITQTDNSTYFAGATCIFGKENFWWVISTTGKPGLPPATMTKIHTHFDKLGFRMDNVAKAGISPLVFKKLKVKAC